MSGGPKDQRVPEDFRLHPTWLSNTWQGGGQAQNQHLDPVRLCWGSGYRQESRAPARPPLLQEWLFFLGVTGPAYKKDIDGQTARETGLAAEPSERQVGTQQPTCLNWSQGASRWPVPGLDRAFPAGLVSLLDPGPGALA